MTAAGVASTIRHTPHQSRQRGTIQLRTIASNAGALSAAATLLARAPAIVSILFLVACASVPTDPEARAEYEHANDPAEPTNRAIFAGNQFVDRNALKPVAQTYTDNVPDRVRQSLHNFLGNLGEPVVGANHLLQGNVDRAWTSVQRFTVNSTLGGAGFFDVATDWSRPHTHAD